MKLLHREKLNNLIIKGPNSSLGVRDIQNMDYGEHLCFTSGSNTYYVSEYLVDGKYIFMNDGGRADTKFNEGKSNYSNHVYAFTTKENKILPKYLYYYLKNKEYIIETVYFQGVGLKNLNKTMFNNYEIVYPSLEIQNEIVRILDKFTMLEAELEAELEARINQFEYYKEQSYTNIDKKHYKKIKEIGTIERGNGLARNDFVDEGVPCIHYGQIYTTFNTWTDKTISNVSEELASKLKEVNHGDIIIAVTSETYEDVCKPLVWMGNETIVTGGHTAILRHNQNPKFIAYYLETHLFTKVKYKLSRGVKVIEVRPFDLLDVEIPVPPIEVQNEIVEKLDKFASLINDLEYGLPKEIEMRRQQYEYYRNKLLTFESEV